MLRSICLGVGVLMAAAWSANASIAVTNLQCEYLDNPLGIDVEVPRFTWEIADTEATRGQIQTGYQIMVASSAALLDSGEADIWNSGTVASSQSVLVPLGGKELVSDQNYYWKVGVHLSTQTNLVWSLPARFSTTGVSPGIRNLTRLSEFVCSPVQDIASVAFNPVNSEFRDRPFSDPSPDFSRPNGADLPDCHHLARPARGTRHRLRILNPLAVRGFDGRMRERWCNPRPAHWREGWLSG